MVKTKVVVLKEGGRISQQERWYYDGNLLEVVNFYVCRFNIYHTIITSSYEFRLGKEK